MSQRGCGLFLESSYISAGWLWMSRQPVLRRCLKDSILQLSAPCSSDQKPAVSVIGAFIVTVAEAEEPLKEPEPEPVHETNEKPVLGEASIGITALAF